MKNKSDQILSTINDLVAGLFFGAMVVIVITSVVLRYFFAFSFRWADELTRYLFIYMVFLGIPIDFRENNHIFIAYFISLFSKKVNYWLQIFRDLVIGVTIVYIGYHSIIIIMGPLSSTISSGLRIPMGYIYTAVIICMGLLLIEIVKRFIELLKAIRISFQKTRSLKIKY